MITFAGVPLLLEDPEGRLQVWRERYMPLDAVRHVLPPASIVDGRTRNRGRGPYKVGLPTPQWTWPKQARLNTLWWPVTGASRWAIGLFLVDANTLTDIRQRLDSSQLGQLQIGYGSIDPPSLEVYSIAMYALREVPLAANAYCLPLVDARYWWQYVDMGEYEIDGETRWEDLINLAAERLGIVWEREPIADSRYAFPDRTELYRPNENAAVMLDALATCLGGRMVFRPDGGVLLQLATEVDWIYPHRFNRSGRADLLAAEESAPRYTPRPAAVKVVFPKFQADAPSTIGETFAITTTAQQAADTSHGLSVVPNTAKVFYDTAPAIFLGDDGPINLSDLRMLARKIAEDYYAWNSFDYTACVEGVYRPGSEGLGRTFTLTAGTDDYYWFHLGYQFPPSLTEVPSPLENEMLGEDWDIPRQMLANQKMMGRYGAYTLVVSHRPNWESCELLHNFRDDESSSSSSSSTSSSSSSSSSTSSSSSSSTSSSSSSSTSSTSSSSSPSSESSSSSQSTSGSSSSSSTSSASSSSSISTSGSSSSSTSTSTSSPSSSSSSGIKRCLVYAPEAYRVEDYIVLPIYQIWVDPFDLTIQCRHYDYDLVYACCEEPMSSSSSSTGSSTSSSSSDCSSHSSDSSSSSVSQEESTSSSQSGAPADGCQACGSDQAVEGEPGVTVDWSFSDFAFGSAFNENGAATTYLGSGRWKATKTITCGGNQVELVCEWFCSGGSQWLVSLTIGGFVESSGNQPIGFNGNYSATFGPGISAPALEDCIEEGFFPTITVTWHHTDCFPM